jgi:hypothetical protein
VLTQGKEGTVKVWDLQKLLELSGEAAVLRDGAMDALLVSSAAAGSAALPHSPAPQLGFHGPHAMVDAGLGVGDADMDLLGLGLSAEALSSLGVDAEMGMGMGMGMDSHATPDPLPASAPSPAPPHRAGPATYLLSRSPLPPLLSADAALPARLAVLKTNAYAFCALDVLHVASHVDTRTQPPRAPGSPAVHVRVLLAAPAEHASSLRIWALTLTFPLLSPLPHALTPPTPALARLPAASPLLAHVWARAPRLRPALLCSWALDAHDAAQKRYGMVMTLRLLDLQQAALPPLPLAPASSSALTLASSADSLVEGAATGLVSSSAAPSPAAEALPPSSPPPASLLASLLALAEAQAARTLALAHALLPPAQRAAAARLQAQRLAEARAYARARGLHLEEAEAPEEAPVDRVCEVAVHGSSGLAALLRARQRQERAVDDVDDGGDDSAGGEAALDGDAAARLASARVDEGFDSDDLPGEEDEDEDEMAGDDGRDSSFPSPAPRRPRSRPAAPTVPSWAPPPPLPCALLAVGTESGHVVLAQLRLALPETQLPQLAPAPAAPLHDALALADAAGYGAAPAEGPAGEVRVGSMSVSRAGLRLAKRVLKGASGGAWGVDGQAGADSDSETEEHEETRAPARLPPASSTEALTPLSQGACPAPVTPQRVLNGLLAQAAAAPAPARGLRPRDPLQADHATARTLLALLARAELSSALLAGRHAPAHAPVSGSGLASPLLRSAGPLAARPVLLWQARLAGDAVMALDVSARAAAALDGCPGPLLLGLRVCAGTADCGLVSALVGVDVGLEDALCVPADAHHGEDGPASWTCVSADGALALGGASMLACTRTHKDDSAAAQPLLLPDAALAAALAATADAATDSNAVSDDDATASALALRRAVHALLHAPHASLLRRGAYKLRAGVLAAMVLARALASPPDTPASAPALAAALLPVQRAEPHATVRVGTAAVAALRGGASVLVGGWDGRARVLSADPWLDASLVAGYAWLRALAATAGVDTGRLLAAGGEAEPPFTSPRQAAAEAEDADTEPGASPPSASALAAKPKQAPPLATLYTRAAEMLAAAPADAVARAAKSLGLRAAEDPRPRLLSLLAARAKALLALPSGAAPAAAVSGADLAPLLGSLGLDEQETTRVTDAVKRGDVDLRDPDAIKSMLQGGGQRAAPPPSVAVDVVRPGDCLVDYLEPDALPALLAALLAAEGDSQKAVLAHLQPALAALHSGLAQRPPAELVATELHTRLRAAAPATVLSAASAMELLYVFLRAPALETLLAGGDVPGAPISDPAAARAAKQRLLMLLGALQAGQHKARRAADAAAEEKPEEGLDLTMTSVPGFTRAHACEAVELLAALGVVPAVAPSAAARVADLVRWVVRERVPPPQQQQPAPEQSAPVDVPSEAPWPASAATAALAGAALRALTSPAATSQMEAAGAVPVPGTSHAQEALLKASGGSVGAVAEGPGCPRNPTVAASNKDGTVSVWNLART